MSSLMLLSLKEKEQILKDLLHDKQSKFRKKVQKVLELINQYSFLEGFKSELEDIKQNFKEKLKTIDIYDVDYEVHQSKANQIDEEFSKKLMELKSKIITLRDKILTARINNLKISNTQKNIEDFLENKDEELKLFLELVKNLDKEEYERIKALEVSEDLKLKEAKVRYLKLNYTMLIKEELQSMSDELDKEEKELVAELLKQKIVEKESFYEFVKQHNKKQQHKEFEAFQKSFEALGYTFEEQIQEDKLQHITTQDKEYKIALRVVNGKISLSFTKLIPKGHTPSQYEKAKDTQKAKKWCSDFDKIKQELAKNGLSVSEELRVEPEVQEIRYEEVDENMLSDRYEKAEDKELKAKEI